LYKTGNYNRGSYNLLLYQKQKEKLGSIKPGQSTLNENNIPYRKIKNNNLNWE